MPASDRFSAVPSELVLYRCVSDARLILAENPDLSPDQAADIACGPRGISDRWRAHVRDLALAAHNGCKRGGARSTK